MSATPDNSDHPSKFELTIGHPPGLFVLFFAEMWERFSYYGMRALLVFYMIKGFLGYNDDQAYSVYGAYTSLVYMTPFLGGLLADRLLGARRAVILGGFLMAVGHLLMTIQSAVAFYLALAFLICGNGFFKPNISCIVGSLYPPHSPKRDSAFTIFYMGVNLGAALAPVLCGYIGEKYGWHYGFGLATIGMLIGCAVFIAPTPLTQALIAVGALITAGTVIWSSLDASLLLMLNTPLAIALLVAAGIATWAAGTLGKDSTRALPVDAGAPPAVEYLLAKRWGLSRLHWAWVGVVLAVPFFALLVAKNQWAGLLLNGFGLVAFGTLIWQAVKSPAVERHRLVVALVLMFFSMTFWAFFEQAGSSINNFTDRNVDRVLESQVVSESDLGRTIALELTQAQLGWTIDGKVFTLDQLDEARKSRATVRQVTLGPEHLGMGLARAADELPASLFQALNPAYILIFGLVFSALWSFLAKRGWEPPAPTKFAFGLLQLSLGFFCLWWGTKTASPLGMVGLVWLILSYLLQTTGELCLSPIGLSMMTRLSPPRLVSTTMGAWFLATAFSQYIAGIIAKFTAVGENGLSAGVPPPAETVEIYGKVFLQIGLTALLVGLLAFALAPLLHQWSHQESPPLPPEARGKNPS